MNSALAILVDIPAPLAPPTAFLAVPGNGQFAEIRDAIRQAAERALLRPQETSETPQQEDFPADILRGIREATVVIGLCAIDSRTKTPNLNVLYEIGLAHSIGKPTIVIAESAATLPSDIASKHAYLYGTFERAAFVNELTTRILQLLQTTHRRLVHPKCPGIALIPAGAMTSWKAIATILRVGKEAHNTYQAIQTGQLWRMMSQLSILARSTGQDMPSQQAHCDRIWGEYLQYYEHQVVPRQHSLAQDLRETDSAISRLVDSVGAGKREKVNLCRSFFALLQERLDAYPGAHRETAEAVNEILPKVESIPDRRGEWGLSQKVGRLNRAANDILLAADSLLLNLVDLIPHEEMPNEHGVTNAP